MSKFDNKKIDKVSYILLLVFILLLIFVIVLLTRAIKLKNSTKDNVNLRLPILKENFKSEFLVDLKDIKQDKIKDYKFSICNYNDKNINNKNIIYNIKITNNSKESVIKLYKDNNNLLKENKKEYLIENEKLSNNKKKCNNYSLIIRGKNVKDKENIQITVTTIDNN